MDKEQTRTVFRWMVAFTIACGLFAGINFALAPIVPAEPSVQAMLFGGAAIILTYVVMLESIARYALALLLTMAAFFLVRYMVGSFVYAGEPISGMAMAIMVVVHVFVLIAMISILDESALFGEQCPQCEARGAVSYEVVDKYRHGAASRAGTLARRTRVTTRFNCRKCGHSWFERALVHES